MDRVQDFCLLGFCFVLFFSLHKLLPSHFGVRRAGCLHGGEKKNFKKDNKTDCICLVTLRKWVN